MTLLRVKERITGPRGLFDVQNEWYGFRDEFRFTIGLAGLMGFGVGCCRPELLPADIRPLSPGTLDRFHPHYGNYLHVPSASILCFIPAHWFDLITSPSALPPFYGTRVVISGLPTAPAGAVRPRMFRDGGADISGVFIDKYQGSNCLPDGSGRPNSVGFLPGGDTLPGGVLASLPGRQPVQPRGAQSGFSTLINLTSNALNPAATTPVVPAAGIWAACRTRGPSFNPTPIWAMSHLGFLGVAHAQALLNSDGPIPGATAAAAWMDFFPWAPKGNVLLGRNTYNLSLSFLRPDLGGNILGFAGGAGPEGLCFTGSCSSNGRPALAQSTHNGQGSGVADVTGNCPTMAPGLTSTISPPVRNEAFRILPESISWGSIQSNANIRAAAGLIPLEASTPEADTGIWWTGLEDPARAYRFAASATGVFHPLASATATQRAMVDSALPRWAGVAWVEGSPSFIPDEESVWGGNSAYTPIVDDVVPRIGGGAINRAFSGPFTVYSDTPSAAGTVSGVRACQLVP